MSPAAIRVLVAGCLIKFLELGTFKCFGVFYMPIYQDINTNHIALATWMTMNQVAANIFAPLITLAAQTYGERPLIILGGVLSMFALCLASFINDVTWFGVLLIISGFGCSGLVAVPVITAIPTHFPDNIQNAFGFMGACGAIGMMVCPPVFEMVIHLYGWRGGMLLLGALNANTIVCGVMMPPIPQGNHYVAIKAEATIEEEDEDQVCQQSSIRDRLIQYLSFLFIDNPKFIAILIADLLSGVLFSGWAIFLVPHAMTRGMSSQLASFLSSSGAIGLVLGRALMGPIIQSNRVTAIQLYIILAVVNAGAFVVDIVFEDFPMLAMLAFVNGLCTGTLVLLSFGASAEILGDDQVVNAYSITLLINPVVKLLGGIILGHMFDNGSNYSFVLLGGISLLIGTVVAVILIPWQKWFDKATNLHSCDSDIDIILT